MASDSESQQRCLANPDQRDAAVYQEAPAEPERSASPPWSSWQDLFLHAQLGGAVMPDSPRSASDWEVVNADSASSVASTSRSVSTPDRTEVAASAMGAPQLHITLTPQGSSAVTLQLEAVGQAPSPKHPVSAVQEQFQQQLRKAQETVMPEFEAARTAAAQDTSLQHEHTDADALPTSTHMSMPMTPALSDSSSEGSETDVVPAEVPEHDAALATAPEQGAVSVVASEQDDASTAASEYQDAADLDLSDALNKSVGQASMMSDASFVDLAADAMDSSFVAEADLPSAAVPLQALKAEPDAAEASAEFGAIREPEAAAIELSAEAQEVLGLLEDCTSELQEQEADDTPATAEADSTVEVEQEVQPEAMSSFQKYSDWTAAAAASVRCRLSHVLSTLQAWSSSAYSSLPGLYSCTGEALEGKAGRQRWDWLHFLLTGSLAVVSATLGYYVTRERMLSKRLSLTNAELSKLLFKVINLQQSAQYSGRVPIIRHTSSVSALTTFPLTHLM